MKTTLFGLLVLVLALPATTTVAVSKPGVCWYDASGKRTGRDSCRASAMKDECSPSATCTIGSSGSCSGIKKGVTYMVVDRSKGWTCPKQR